MDHAGVLRFGKCRGGPSAARAERDPGGPVVGASRLKVSPCATPDVGDLPQDGNHPTLELRLADLRKYMTYNVFELPVEADSRGPSPGMDRAKIRRRVSRDSSPRANGSVLTRWMDALAERAGAGTESSSVLAKARDTTAEASPDASGNAPVDARGFAATVSRWLNIVLALLALVAVLPLLLLIAVAIKLTSRGPVLYTQERVGLDRRVPGTEAGNHRRTVDLGGRPFTIYKFRTMRVDAEQRTGAVWATQNDPRITPVGRFLRQYRLDEIPQLLTVLRGEMNIVGPRPERPTIFAELRGHISEYPLRQRAKPGITGLAQINHHYDRSLDDVRTKVHYDLEYIRRQSVSEDFRIMLKTVPVILLRRGGW